VRSKLLTVIFVLFLIIGSALTHAQDKPALPQESINKLIKLYETQGEDLKVNRPEDAKKYIELFDGLESLKYEINSLDLRTRELLSDTYSDYALSYLKYNNRNPSPEDKRKAEALYLKAIELDPRSSDTIENLATLYYDQGDYGNAAKYFGMSYDLDPSNSLAKDLRDASIKKMEE
jgi:tetratricopeptide (TPR) repeat protein